MLELVNTSLPNGLIAGTHGFATVAMTKGLPDVLRARLEALCAYTHKTSAHDATYHTQNPVNWLHAILPQGEHVVGRVAASDFDYTGRTNRLGRILVFGAREMPAAGAAAVLSAESARLSAPWSGEPRYLAEDKAAASRLASLQPPAFATPSNWTALFGHDGAELARRLALQLERNLKSGGRPIYFKTSAAFDQNGTKLLGLFSDLIELLPEGLRPSVTFSTYPDALPAGTNCLLRGAFDGDRSFAVASSTQPWVDCEHAKVVHPELLPTEAEAAKPKAALTGKAEAQAAPTELDTVEAASERKPLRLKQQPASQRHTHGSASPYLPPPRKDDWTQIILLGAIVAVALAVACVGLYMIKRGSTAISSFPDEPQQTGESTIQAQDPETAFTECKIAVQGLSQELRSRIQEISKSEKPDKFSPLADDAKKNAAEAMEKARGVGVAEERLLSLSEEFDAAVRDFEDAIVRRRDAISGSSKKAESGVSVSSEAVVVTAKPSKEAVSDKPLEPADTSPPFMKAEKVVVIGQNTLGDQAFLASHEGGFQIFFYGTEEWATLSVIDIKRKKGPGGFVFKPLLKDIKNKGNFIIYYSKEDKTAYWLWTLPQNADKGEQWFAAVANGTSNEIDLRRKTFGNSDEVYKLYEDHLGAPTYTVSRHNDNEIEGRDAKEELRQTKNATASCKLFQPEQSEIDMIEETLRKNVAGWQAKLADVDSKVNEWNNLAQQVEQKMKDLASAIGERNKLKAEIKECNPSKGTDKNKKNDLEIKCNSKNTEIDRLAREIADMSQWFPKIPPHFFLSITSADLRVCGSMSEIINAVRRNNNVNVNDKGMVKRIDAGAPRAEMQSNLNRATKELDDFKNNPEKKWLPQVIQSRYAVTGVVGSKEPKKR